MKILWVKAGGLVPLDMGGKIRSFQMMKALSRAHAITFFTYYQQHANDQHKILESIFDRVICCPLAIPDSGTVRDCLRYAKNLFTLSPYALNKYKDAVVARCLADLVLREKYDILIADFCVGGVNFPWTLPHTKILFTHNAEAEIWRQHHQLASHPLWKLVTWREWKTMIRQESAYARRADHVFTVSENDKEYFSRFIPAQKITSIPTGVDAEYFHPNGEEETADSIVFTGAMDWKPNEDAVLYFCAQILPRIKKHLANLTFWVVGRNPSDRIKQLSVEDPTIRVSGTVEDVRPYLHRAAVCVVPLRIGSGTRMKIFEAMACGKAVVSTSIGAQGLPVNDGRNIALADNPDDFAGRVVELLRTHGKRMEMGKQARTLVAERYSWPAIADEISRLLDRIHRNQGASETHGIGLHRADRLAPQQMGM